MIPRLNQEPGDAARYIAGLAADLRRIAMGARLDFLAYLLAMVEQEANNEADQRRSGPPDRQVRETR